ncbi:unnamed protein product [Clonostachys rhizophaga]|uniref:Uncharacterized protein n=1 Tax=Clonostachys rhizophaga TaxID=160324 RepID=A0A9N9V6C3_9HYPO|nr:unnamed protein product [Clonostachys rhizophaga]
MQQRRRGFRETYARYHADEHLVKKYIRLIKQGKGLPKPESDSTGGAMNACISIEEERAIITYLQLSRFKKRYPEISYKKEKPKEIIRIGAELQIPEIQAWFAEYRKQKARLYNDEEGEKAYILQLGNKESLTAVDAISAAGKAIPSFLILSANILLEDYTASTLNDDIILTRTSSGYNNADRAFQWLQHFNW